MKNRLVWQFGLGLALGVLPLISGCSKAEAESPADSTAALPGFGGRDACN